MPCNCIDNCMEAIMATTEMKFTKGALDDAAHQGGQATRYRDPRFPNLYLEVGARSKTWRFRKFWKSQNFTEALGNWPQMGWIEAAQEAAVRSDGIEEKGVLIKDAEGLCQKVRCGCCAL